MQNINNQFPLKVLVVGATGGSGRAVVNKLLNEGHKVTAFSRHADVLNNGAKRLITMNGDVMRPADLNQAVEDQDVVVITLGIHENPLRVRFLGTKHTPADVRSSGTRNVINAMHKHGVKRLIVQSTYGAGETRGLLRFIDQLFFSLILKPQIDDTELQEQIVRNSGLNWVIAQPVHLTNDDSNTTPFLSASGETRVMKVARKSVAHFHSLATRDSRFNHQSIAISG